MLLNYFYSTLLIIEINFNITKPINEIIEVQKQIKVIILILTPVINEITKYMYKAPKPKNNTVKPI